MLCLSGRTAQAAECARQLKGIFCAKSSAARISVSFNGRGRFPWDISDKLAGLPLEFRGTRLFRADLSDLKEALLFLASEKMAPAGSRAFGGLTVERSADAIIVNHSFSHPLQAEISALRNWHKSERQKLIELAGNNYQAIIGPGPTVASLLSKHGIEFLQKACSIAQRTLDQDKTPPSGDFCLSVFGSMSYGPHISSDTDFQLFYTGHERSYFEGIAEETGYIALECGAPVHNLAEVHLAGLKALCADSLALRISGFTGKEIMMKAVPDMLLVPGIGAPGLFEDLRKAAVSYSLMKTRLSSVFWRRSYYYLFNLPGKKDRENLYCPTNDSLLKLKIIFSLARFFAGEECKTMEAAFLHLKEKGTISPAEEKALLESLEFFMKLVNHLDVKKEEYVTTRNLSCLSQAMGFDSSQRLLDTISRHQIIVDIILQKLRALAGHREKGSIKASASFTREMALKDFICKLKSRFYFGNVTVMATILK